MTRLHLPRRVLALATLALPLFLHTPVYADHTAMLMCRYTPGAVYIYHVSETLRDSITGPNAGLYQAYNGQAWAPTGSMSATTTMQGTLTYHILSVNASGDATVSIQDGRVSSYTVIGAGPHSGATPPGFPTRQYGGSSPPAAPITAVLHPNCGQTGGLASHVVLSLLSLMTLPPGTVKAGARWQSKDSGTALGPSNVALTVQVRHTLVHAPSAHTPDYAIRADTALSYIDTLILSQAAPGIRLKLTEVIAATGAFVSPLGHFSTMAVHSVQQGDVMASTPQMAGHLTETLAVSLVGGTAPGITVIGG